MKNIKIKAHILVAYSLFFGWGLIQAQTDADLLRYTMLDPSGGARFSAMGGAFGALGADFSAASVNPASLGMYSRNALDLTGGVTTTYNRATYYGEKHGDESVRINLPQVGSVWLLYDRPENKFLKRLQLGVGVNRLNDYNGAYRISGFNKQSSYMEAVAAQNYGAQEPTTDNQWGGLNVPGYLAYNSYLLDPVSNSSAYKTFLEGGNLQQTKYGYSNGNITELSVALGTNISDKLYLGINFAIPFAHYYQRSTLVEENTKKNTYPNTYNFNSYSYTESFSTSGTGFTFKIGAMYQAFPFMRIGAWFHTPTGYSMSEDYDAKMKVDMTLPSGVSKETNIPTSHYRYKIKTPAKGGVALGFIVGKHGVIDVEGEMLNYKGMKFKINDDYEYERSQNQLVKENYKLGGTVRIGTEWRYGIGRFRAGYAFTTSPYRDHTLSSSWQKHRVSAGVGLVFGRWNIDFAAVYNMGRGNEYLYNIIDGSTMEPLVNSASLEDNKITYSFGFGVRF